MLSHGILYSIIALLVISSTADVLSPRAYDPNTANPKPFIRFCSDVEGKGDCSDEPIPLTGVYKDSCVNVATRFTHIIKSISIPDVATAEHYICDFYRKEDAEFCRANTRIQLDKWATSADDLANVGGSVGDTFKDSNIGAFFCQCVTGPSEKECFFPNDPPPPPTPARCVDCKMPGTKTRS